MTDIRCIQIGASTVQGEPIDCKTHEPFRNPIPNAFAGRLVSIRVGDQIVTGKLIPSIRKPEPDDMTRPATRSTKHRRAKMTDNTEAPDWESFGRAVMQVWPEGDLDGFELQELAIKHHVLLPEPDGFDPSKHEDVYGCADAGDDWFVLNPRTDLAELKGEK